MNVQLTPEMIELLLTLTRIHRDELEHYMRGRYSNERTRWEQTPGDARDAVALELAEAAIKALEDASPK